MGVGNSQGYPCHLYGQVGNIDLELVHLGERLKSRDGSLKVAPKARLRAQIFIKFCISEFCADCLTVRACFMTLEIG